MRFLIVGAGAYVTVPAGIVRSTWAKWVYITSIDAILIRRARAVES